MTARGSLRAEGLMVMRSNHVAVVIAAVLAMGLPACHPSSPTSPTPAPAPTGSATLWSVTQRFASVTGPDNCWVREQRARWTGAVFPDLPMTITRSAGSVMLEGEFFDVNYAGTVSGPQLSATGVRPLAGGGRPCQDGTSFEQRPGVSNLTGRFSPNDRELTATEANSYLLTTGELVTYVWEWQATRR